MRSIGLPVVTFFLALACFACGGKVFVDPSGTGGGNSNSSGTKDDDACAGKQCGDGCSPCKGCKPGHCTSNGICTNEDVHCPVGAGPCEGKFCGEACTVCNDFECLTGACSMDGTCDPTVTCIEPG